MKSFRRLLALQVAILIVGILTFITFSGISILKLASIYEKKHLSQISTILAKNIKLITELYPNKYLIKETMKKVVNEIPALDGICFLNESKEFCYPKHLIGKVRCKKEYEIAQLSEDNIYICIPIYEEYATQFLEKKKEGYFVAVFNNKHINQFKNFWILTGILISMFFLITGILVIVSIWIDVNVDFNKLRKFISELKSNIKQSDMNINDFKVEEIRRTAELILKLTEKISKLNDRIKKLAITDPLTGLFNRNYINMFIKTSYIPLWKRRKFPLTVAILDIDNFKSINDIYGHMKGDEVLKKFGQIIRKTIRNSDIPIRFGGEEVLIIFPSPTKEQALTAIKRIREQLIKENFGIGRPVTFSSGLSGFPSDIDSPGDLEKLIEIADQRLYKAKKLGKNRDIID